MANSFKKVTGAATSAGSTIITVPTDATFTIIGLRAANGDSNNEHEFHVKVAGTLVTGLNTPLPIGSALDALVGSKIIASGGDAIVAFSDTDNDVEIYISYMEET